jgi:carbamoyltransferase
MKDRINALVKHREGFRPFAPSILAERQSDVLDTADPGPYMCVNAVLAEASRARFAAASHVDGSVRYQTVSRTSNPRYHEVIEQFAALTGIPGLLNTSFNDSEPIVESPADALACFLQSEMDCLAIGDFFITKSSGAELR